jgi:hypothetical protein
MRERSELVGDGTALRDLEAQTEVFFEFVACSLGSSLVELAIDVEGTGHLSLLAGDSKEQASETLELKVQERSGRTGPISF